MQTFASLISKTLNVFTSSLAVMLVAVLVQDIALVEKLLWLVLGFSSAALPVGVYYLQYKRGNISSFWAPQLSERTKANLAWVVAAAIFSLIAFWLGAPRLILAVVLVFLAVGLVNLALSTSFKISVHAEAITLFVLTSILAVSVNLIILVVLIILVGWSRVYLKAHDLSEVSLGVLLTIVLVFVIFNFFGLATF